jgi:hypothetical protein
LISLFPNMCDFPSAVLLPYVRLACVSTIFVNSPVLDRLALQPGSHCRYSCLSSSKYRS